MKHSVNQKPNANRKTFMPHQPTFICKPTTNFLHKKIFLLIFSFYICPIKKINYEIQRK